MKKICSKCGVEKLLDCFYADKRHIDGLRSSCKTCHAKEGGKHRETNREAILKRHKKYRKAHREDRAKYNKEYFRTHKNQCAVMTKNWLKANPERGKLYQKRHHQKRREDIRYKLNNSMRATINRCLNGGKGWRSWTKLVGYTVKELIDHLKTTVKKPYSWDDFVTGKIKFHVDHKVPLSVFNFTKPEHEDFKRCWALKNLQLIPAQENLEKSAKLFEHFQPSLLLQV